MIHKKIIYLISCLVLFDCLEIKASRFWVVDESFNRFLCNEKSGRILQRSAPQIPGRRLTVYFIDTSEYPTIFNHLPITTDPTISNPYNVKAVVAIPQDVHSPYVTITYYAIDTGLRHQISII